MLARYLYDFRCWLVDKGLARQYPPMPRAKVLRIGASSTPRLDLFLKLGLLVIGLALIWAPVGGGALLVLALLSG